MIPRLQKFYAGDPERWWQMPVALLRVFVRMLPQLMAEHALQETRQHMIASGNMKPSSAESIIRQWERAAQIEEPVQKLDEETKRAALPQMGITLG